MMIVEFTQKSFKDLQKLDKVTVHRILSKIKFLSDHFHELDHQALDGPWHGMFKLRVGNYRIIYSWLGQSESITIHFVRHRREIYRSHNHSQ